MKYSSLLTSLLLSTVLFFGFAPEPGDISQNEVLFEKETASLVEIPADDLIGLNVRSLNFDVNTLQERSSCTAEAVSMNCDLQLINDGDGNPAECATMLCTTNECCANSCVPTIE